MLAWFIHYFHLLFFFSFFKKFPKVQNLNYSYSSYAGYITVNQTYNSNMFFWFFPAQTVNVDVAPVLLWFLFF